MGGLFKTSVHSDQQPAYGSGAYRYIRRTCCSLLTDEDFSKIRHYVAERSTFDDDTSYIIPGKCPGDTVAIGAALPFIKEFIDGIYLI